MGNSFCATRASTGRRAAELCQTAPANYRLAITGGGSGGHVYPGLAVLEQLRRLALASNPQLRLDILWIGSRNGIERRLVEAHSRQLGQAAPLALRFEGVACGKLRRYFSWRNFSDLFCVLLGICQGLWLLRSHRPCLLFSKGGFASLPALIAARLLGIPSLAHESDLDPGLATRIAVRLVGKLYLPYEASRRYFAPRFQDRLAVSGNPVRAEFVATDQVRTASPLLPSDWGEIGQSSLWRLRRPLLLVLGGSLGAAELNAYIPALLKEGQWYVLHQCGQGDYQQFCGLEQQFSHYKVVPFIAEGLGQLYQLCRHSGGLVISRAGAGSLWEILASRSRALLLPLQSGSRGEQLRNAQFFQQQGWADCFLADKLRSNAENAHNLLAQIHLILEHRDNLLSAKPVQLARLQAAEIIARDIWQQLRGE